MQREGLWHYYKGEGTQGTLQLQCTHQDFLICVPSP